MLGLGTIINTAAIVGGGVLGVLLKGALSERIQHTVMKATGICVLFIGIAGAMEGMLSLHENGITSGGSMMIILSMVIGALLGEIIDIEKRIEQFGKWIRKKTHSEGDGTFLEGFLTASFTVCIGAMAVVGSIQDGITGDYSLLAAKAVLDFIIVMIMAAALGKGCIFAAIPVAIFQGIITIAARFIEPLMTDAATSNLSLVGSMLIFCVGVNLVWEIKLKVANMLPALAFAVALAFIL